MADDDPGFYDHVYTSTEREGIRSRVLCEKVDARDGGRHRYRVAIEQMGMVPGEAPIPGRPDVVDINFQNGSVGKFGVNGIEDEGLLAVLVDRYERFYDEPSECSMDKVQTSIILKTLRSALYWMKEKRQDEIKRAAAEEENKP